MTLYEDGSPTAVPVWYEWDGEHARVFTGRESEKVRRIQTDPRVALSLEEPVGVPETWVTIEGTAAIEDGGIEVARRLAPRYYTSEQAAQALERWQQYAGNLVTIVITPRRIRSSAAA